MLLIVSGQISTINSGVDGLRTSTRGRSIPTLSRNIGNYFILMYSPQGSYDQGQSCMKIYRAKKCKNLAFQGMSHPSIPFLGFFEQSNQLHISMMPACPPPPKYLPGTAVVQGGSDVSAACLHAACLFALFLVLSSVFAAASAASAGGKPPLVRCCRGCW